MNILVINAGSSSLKYQLLNPETQQVLAKGLCERIGIDGRLTHKVPAKDAKYEFEIPMPTHAEAIQAVLDALLSSEHGVIKSAAEIDAVGHRVVHGGEKFAGSVLITDEVMAALEECIPLAPLHNPANITGINACTAVMGKDVPQVAVFDTAFHQTMPEEAYMYGLPYEYYEKYKIRRYGFHGTSHSYVSRKAAEVLDKKYEDLKIIVCHLGNGASVSAVKNGKCVDTSMGLTPLEGLIMGTRSGDLDPAIVEFICNKENKDVHEVLNILNKESGIYGLSEDYSSDFRDLEEGYVEDKENCIRAVDAFCYRVAKYVGAYVAAMNGVDAICFTAGVGENSGFVRSLICKYFGYLGVALNEEENEKRGEALIVSTKDSRTKVLVIPTNEELAIARETAALVQK